MATNNDPVESPYAFISKHELSPEVQEIILGTAQKMLSERHGQYDVRVETPDISFRIGTEFKREVIGPYAGILFHIRLSDGPETKQFKLIAPSMIADIRFKVRPLKRMELEQVVAQAKSN